jgi:hypothetical protein
MLAVKRCEWQVSAGCCCWAARCCNDRGMPYVAEPERQSEHCNRFIDTQVQYWRIQTTDVCCHRLRVVLNAE